MIKEIVATLLAALAALSFVLGITPNEANGTDNTAHIQAGALPNTSFSPQEDESSAPSPDSSDAETSSPPVSLNIPLPEYPSGAKHIPLYINGRQAPDGFAAVFDGIVYAPIESFCTLLGVGNIIAEEGEPYISSEGRCIPCSTSSVSVTVIDAGGILCAPIEALASASGQRADIAVSGAVVVSGTPTFPTAEEVYGEEDLYWLSRIISAEARGECFEGQLAVGCVVINRTEHKSFPDTIYEVIYDNKFGVQFSPAHSGSVKKDPTASAVRAAKLCLEGFSLSDSILFFFNSSIAAGSWITSNRTFTVTIGNHDFYS
jgi:N-acetylmuramoyl-L-alanine amidase